MKKILHIASFAFLLPAAMAMEEANDQGSESNSASTSQTTTPVGSPRLTEKEAVASSSKIQLPPETPVKDILANLEENPDNRKKYGGVFGYFAEEGPSPSAVQDALQNLARENKKLRKLCLRLQSTNALLEQNNADLRLQVTTAGQSSEFAPNLLRQIRDLQAQVDQKEAEKLALKELERQADDRAMVAESRAELLKEKELALMSEVSVKDATILINQKRAELLNAELEELKKTVEALQESDRQLGILRGENNDLKEMQERNKKKLQELSSENTEYKALQAEQERIQRVLKEKEAKLHEVEKENVVLKQAEQENGAKVTKLKQATKANDYYTQILEMIKNPKVSDDELALFIMSVQIVQKRDLDQLSDGRKMRLIEALINVSKPYEQRPVGSVTCEYHGRFRTLGNKFTPNGLGWNGTPLQFSECTFKGSEFEKSSATVSAYAMRQLNKK